MNAATSHAVDSVCLCSPHWIISGAELASDAFGTIEPDSGLALSGSTFSDDTTVSALGTIVGWG